MPFGGSTRGAAPFNGGTITNPITIDLSADLADRTALDVIQPSTFGFSVRPFRFRQTDFAYLQMETTGIVSTAGNDFSTGGASAMITGTLRAGNLRATNIQADDGSGGTEHELDGAGDGLLAFYSTNLVAQQALTPGTATPEQIATVLQTYGLSHA